MPRNGSGVYSLPAGVIVANGDTLDASQHNPALQDFATDANTPRPIVAGGTGSSSASAARTALGLAIGTDVQSHDAALDAIAGLTYAADKGIYATGVDTFATYDLTSTGRSISGSADAAAARTAIGITSAGSAVVTAADAAAQRTAIGFDDAVKSNLNASGSAPIYACRAWVNFNGTGAVAIRASGNVSSITDNGVGDYTVIFATAMPDANYSVVCTGANMPDGQATPLTYGIRGTSMGTAQLPATGSVRVTCHRANSTGDLVDSNLFCVSIFR